MKKPGRHFACSAAAMLLAAGAWLAPSNVHADVVAYNNFGPGDDFVTGTGWVLRGPDSGVYVAFGFEFTAEASGGITSIVMPLWHKIGPNAYTLRLYDADLDEVLGEWEVEGQTGHPTPISEFDADGSVRIEQGGVYWLAALTHGTTRGQWKQNSVGVSSRFARDDFGVWQVFGPDNQAAFRIMVSADGDCPPDWNGDGVVDSDDLLDFLADWSAGDADYNGDGVTDSDDLLDFLSDWSNPGQFPGC